MSIREACDVEAISHHLDYRSGVLMDEASSIDGILSCICLQWLDFALFHWVPRYARIVSNL
jgi:hypothetical protein